MNSELFIINLVSQLFAQKTSMLSGCDGLFCCVYVVVVGRKASAVICCVYFFDFSVATLPIPPRLCRTLVFMVLGSV